MQLREAVICQKSLRGVGSTFPVNRAVHTNPLLPCSHNPFSLSKKKAPFQSKPEVVCHCQIILLSSYFSFLSSSLVGCTLSQSKLLCSSVSWADNEQKQTSIRHTGRPKLGWPDVLPTRPALSKERVETLTRLSRACGMASIMKQEQEKR
jgi:hypothetical protein